MSRTVSARRLGVLTTTAALAVSTLLVSPAQAASSPSADRAESWLAGELEGGLVPNGFGGFDVGLSIDAALLAAAAGDSTTAAAIRDAVAPLFTDYAAGGTYDVGASYGNQTAKVLAMVVATGGDPRDVGGVDVLERLEAITSPSGRTTGIGEYNDADSVIGQAFAVDALTGAGSPRAADARDYLAGLQCADGSFTLVMPEDGEQADCSPGGASTDATAFALAALAKAPGTSPAVIDRSVGWLGGAVQPDGSYGSDASLPDANSNSTGLAAAALGDACRVEAAHRSAAWLRSIQVDGGDEDGAVAYDAAAHDAAEADGIEDFQRDQFRRATAQAALGLVWDPSAPTALRLSAAGGVLTIDGARAGQTVCLTTPTGTSRLTGTGSPLTVPITAPASGSATYTATAGPGQAGLTLTAPATPAAPVTPTAPVVTPPTAAPSPAARFGGKRLVRGERRVVRASGLRPGTKVVLRLRDRTVATGRSRADGTVRLRFRVQTRLGPARLVLRAPGTKLRSVVRVVR